MEISDTDQNPSRCVVCYLGQNLWVGYNLSYCCLYLCLTISSLLCWSRKREVLEPPTAQRPAEPPRFPIDLQSQQQTQSSLFKPWGQERGCLVSCLVGNEQDPTPTGREPMEYPLTVIQGIVGAWEGKIGKPRGDTMEINYHGLGA